MADTRMSDDEFRQLVQRTLGEHDTRMAAHEAAMTKMDRQYEKLLEVQLDLARSHDEHEAKMDLMRATLDAIKEILRERRN
jgi:hypothetical protein